MKYFDSDVMLVARKVGSDACRKVGLSLALKVVMLDMCEI